jgi:di/tricarboxylate transporter
MPILNSVAQMVAKPFPQVISPKTRAVLDHVNVGVLLMSGAWFWRRNKRAALAALVGGGTVMALNLLTSYPGGAKKVISFRSRREIDLGLAAMISTMPEFFAFKGDQERKLFVAEGVLMAVVTELTQFPESNVERKRFRAA